MKKYCYAYFNKLGAFYGVPFFVDHKEGFEQILNQSLFSAEKDVLERLKEEELYYLGEFDNVTAEFKYEKEFVCSMSSMVSDVIAKKFGKEGEQDVSA